MFKELLTGIILFHNLSKCIYIIHTELNLFQRAVLVIEPPVILITNQWVSTIITPIFQTRTPKHREIEQWAQGHTAHKQSSLGWSLGSAHESLGPQPGT